MDAREWEESKDPQTLINWLYNGQAHSNRKFYLFSLAALRLTGAGKTNPHAFFSLERVIDDSHDRDDLKIVRSDIVSSGILDVLPTSCKTAMSASLWSDAMDHFRHLKDDPNHKEMVFKRHSERVHDSQFADLIRDIFY